MTDKLIIWKKFSCTNPYMLRVVWPLYRSHVWERPVATDSIYCIYPHTCCFKIAIWVCLFYVGQQLKGRNIRTNWAARKAITPQSKFCLLVWIMIWPVQPCTLFPWKTMRKKFLYEGCMCQGDRIGEVCTALLEMQVAPWNWWWMTETVLLLQLSFCTSRVMFFILLWLQQPYLFWIWSLTLNF